MVTFRHQFLFQILESDEEHWHHEEQGYRAYAHTSYHTYGEGNVTIGTRTCRQSERQHTHNHGKGCHQDRTQTYFSSRHGSLDDGHPFVSTGGGIFGQKNRRLRKQTDKHNQTYLQIHIIGDAEDIGKDETT